MQKTDFTEKTVSLSQLWNSIAENLFWEKIPLKCHWQVIYRNAVLVYYRETWIQAKSTKSSGHCYSRKLVSSCYSRVIATFWNWFQETANAIRRPRLNSPRASATTDNRYILWTVRRVETDSSTQLLTNSCWEVDERCSAKESEISFICLFCIHVCQWSVFLWYHANVRSEECRSLKIEIGSNVIVYSAVYRVECCLQRRVWRLTSDMLW